MLVITEQEQEKRKSNNHKLYSKKRTMHKMLSSALI
jgi:hypothetical protein